MTPSATAAKLAAGSNIAAASGAAFGATFLVLGIPLAALAAALLGAGLSLVRAPAIADEKIPARMFGVLVDAFVGGWFAVALVNLTPLHAYGADQIPLEAIAGLLALFWRTLRLWISAKADAAFDAALRRWFGTAPAPVRAAAEPEDAAP